MYESIFHFLPPDNTQLIIARGLMVEDKPTETQLKLSIIVP